MAERVMYEHNVVLHFSEDSGSTKITIIGKEECVEAAKLHLILEEQKLLGICVSGMYCVLSTLFYLKESCQICYLLPYTTKRLNCYLLLQIFSNL